MDKVICTVNKNTGPLFSVHVSCVLRPRSCFSVSHSFHIPETGTGFFRPATIVHFDFDGLFSSADHETAGFAVICPFKFTFSSRPGRHFSDRVFAHPSFFWLPSRPLRARPCLSRLCCAASPVSVLQKQKLLSSQLRVVLWTKSGASRLLDSGVHRKF